jgi:hypothetical protein
MACTPSNVDVTYGRNTEVRAKILLSRQQDGVTPVLILRMEKFKHHGRGLVYRWDIVRAHVLVPDYHGLVTGLPCADEGKLFYHSIHNPHAIDSDEVYALSDRYLREK